MKYFLIPVRPCSEYEIAGDIGDVLGTPQSWTFLTDKDGHILQGVRVEIVEMSLKLRGQVVARTSHRTDSCSATVGGDCAATPEELVVLEVLTHTANARENVEQGIRIHRRQHVVMIQLTSTTPMSMVKMDKVCE